MKKTRHRGQRFLCPCQHESFVLTRRGAFHELVGASVEADTRPHDGWTFLTGSCGAGVALRFKGVKVTDSRDVLLEEMKRVRALPARRIEPYEQVLRGLDEKARLRLDAIVAEIRDALAQGMKQWLVAGERLTEAKRLFKGDRGAFGCWVKQNGMDPHHAHRFMTAYDLTRALPAFSPTLVKMGQEKLVLLERLPGPKRIELLEAGVPVNGAVVPIDRVTYRQFNEYVRSITGKSTRGRKAKEKPAGDEPREHYGLPAEFGEALHAALGGLQALKALAKKKRFAELDPKRRRIAGAVWEQAWDLAYRLEHELGLGELRQVEG